MSSALDILDELEGGDSEEDVEAMTAADVLQKLEEAWFNEKFAPELLEARTDLVDCMLEQMAQMEENIARAKRGDFKAWFNEKFAPELLEARTDLVDCMLEQMAQMEENIARAKRGDFKVSLHRMEIDRIRYIVTSYLRCRLHKIEQFTSHVLEEKLQCIDEDSSKLSPDEFQIEQFTSHVLEEEQQRKDEDASKLSPDEFQFARDYAESLESHMSSLALRHMPQNLQSLNPAQTAPRPNLDKYVFLRVNEATEGVLVEEETLDTGEEIVDLEKEDQHIMRYKPLMSLVNSGVVSLI